MNLLRHHRSSALMAAVVVAALPVTLAGCSGSSSSVGVASSTSGPTGAVSFPKQSPSPGDSQGVVVANTVGRKVVYDSSLPVFNPPVVNGSVPTTEWPVAGYLFSIKELSAVFPDAAKIALDPTGTNSLKITVFLPNTTINPTFQFTITSVGTETQILNAFDAARSSSRATNTNADGKPASGYIYFDDGSYNTQRLSVSNATNDPTYSVVIGNGTTAAQITMTAENLFQFAPGNFSDNNATFNQQIMPLLMQLLAARM
ncbi:hypothetical protein [Rudaeicoccus suwonensis]|uniref:Lipoprotein n=1 Tax=Rudaeicoccus suwonensis TaxID=657409 RepID=A0A561E980_9MICO|nr:hypothetical protein [Rudaeicoccus suwonensis]TWE12175.1 hypothetical protein BKA23_0971 [Rudaeicoccus suwonensis]